MANGSRKRDLWRGLDTEKHLELIDDALDEHGYRLSALDERIRVNFKELNTKIDAGDAASASTNTKALKWLVFLISGVLASGATVAVVNQIVSSR